MNEFKLIKRTINTENGNEIIIEKRHVLNKDRWQDRLWVLQPQDPVFIKLNMKMKEQGLWT